MLLLYILTNHTKIKTPTGLSLIMHQLISLIQFHKKNLNKKDINLIFLHDVAHKQLAIVHLL